MSGSLAIGHLPRMSRQTRLSTNGKDANDMMPGVVHRSPGIYLHLGKTLNSVCSLLKKLFVLLKMHEQKEKAFTGMINNRPGMEVW